MQPVIQEYSHIRKSEWNDIIRSFNRYEVFYLNEYVNAFACEDNCNGTPILLYYTNGEDRAINVVFKRDVSEDKKFKGQLEKNKYYDLITPYGYGGFMGEITDYYTMEKTYNTFCVNNGYVCEFVRFELFSEYYRYYSGEISTRMSNVIRRLNMPSDDIWMDFKQKVRKNVKRANKNGLEIIIDKEGIYIDDFMRIYDGTMDRNNADEKYYFSKSFLENINKMKNNTAYFYVVYEDKIISAELVIYGSENCYSYLGGTDKDYFDLRPNDFLKYEIIKWAKKMGFKNFVLGGGYGSNDGIFQYKTALAPHGIVDFYIGKKIFDQVKYDHLVSLRQEESDFDMNREFFPLYRA